MGGWGGVRGGWLGALVARCGLPPGLQFAELAGRHLSLGPPCDAPPHDSFPPQYPPPPGIKFTYAATIHVPAQLTALMSALPAEEGEGGAPAAARARPGTRAFCFRQPMPISSYLFALAAGNLASRCLYQGAGWLDGGQAGGGGGPIHRHTPAHTLACPHTHTHTKTHTHPINPSRELGPISRVWSEPEMVEAGAYEFGETDAFLRAAEAVAGPYEWGRYDLLLLPPSFPFGGMENPCVTFVTPTLLAGDRSLANVVAHEISHSWMGNLVTNFNCELWSARGFVWCARAWRCCGGGRRNGGVTGAARGEEEAQGGRPRAQTISAPPARPGEHFWLNEGFTVFLERKILGRMYGEQVGG